MGNHHSRSSRSRRRFRPTSKTKEVPLNNTTATTTTTASQAQATSASTTPSPKSQWITKHNSRKITDFYSISSHHELGRGDYGVVRKCRHLETGQWFAVKTIPKNTITKPKVLRREVKILEKIQHPHVLHLEEIFEDETYLHFVTELCHGGELFDEILKRQQFSEQDAAKLMQDILEAIRYCHDDLHIVHRDLKPENFLIRDSSSSEKVHIKIIDFGLSRFAREKNENGEAVMMKTKVGTPYYVAPEVLLQRYTKACDMWSLGVITYILLCGYPPFYGDSDADIFKSVLSGYYNFPSPEWDEVSETAKDFIRHLLLLEPSARMTASQALQHEFIVKHNQKESAKLEKQKKQPKRRSSVKSDQYQRDRALRKLKKVIYAHLAKQQQGETSSSSLSISDADSERQRLQSAFDFFVNTTNSNNDDDDNSDQGLTMDHLQDILKHSGQAWELMKFVDTNQDGRICFDEFYHAITTKEEEVA